MKDSETIVCKPTPWFTLRAGAILAMFSVFSVLFYIDGTTGYREKNLEFYLHQTFTKATEKFAAMDHEKPLTPTTWQEFASKQTVDFPKDPEVLPVTLKQPMPWPKILTDFDQIKGLQSQILWTEYSGKNGYSNEPKEKAFTAKKINEQIRIFYLCAAFSGIALFFFVRTSRRSISVDHKNYYSANGSVVPFSEMKTLDLRKWETKGIAVISYQSGDKIARAKVDGLTYGGFKKEKGEPAEKLMAQIRKNFTGEIVEYTEEPSEETESEKTPEI